MHALWKCREAQWQDSKFWVQIPSLYNHCLCAGYLVSLCFVFFYMEMEILLSFCNNV